MYKGDDARVDENQSGPLTERRSCKDSEKQRLSTTVGQRAGETLKGTDPSYSCPAAERIGGDWGGPAGTCSWHHTGCVCVCVFVSACVLFRLTATVTENA